MNIFIETMSVMSRKGIEMENTQEGEFIDDFLNDRIQGVGVISFHPIQRQIKIEGIKEDQQKTYKILEPSKELVKFIWAAGNSKVKKSLYHYLAQVS